MSDVEPISKAAPEQDGAPIDRLRLYQKRDYRDVLQRCEEVRRVLYVAFMGSGKTVLAAALIRTWVARGERVLILMHTREILRQTHEKLLAAGIDENHIGWVWRNHPRTNATAPIQLASLDTLVRRELPRGITRLVVDEAHHAPAKKWRDVIDAYPNARALGLTGTPARRDGQPLGDLFDELIQSEPTENLIEQGWIAQPTYWTPEWKIDLLRSSGRDFSDDDAARMMAHSKVLESMVEEYLKHASGLPALGFAATREKAAEYAQCFSAAGVSADTLFGSDTDLKRRGTLARLRKGAISVLWTCDVLSEGWDYPGLRCVLLARPTLSIARYLQQVARCMRPGAPPVVLDLWGAWSVFDPPWADFGWSLQTRARASLYVGKREPTGETSWLPPVEVEGELVRADASKRTPCSVCGEPATRTSAIMARRRGGKAYCTRHRKDPNARRLAPLPCAICGEPTSRSSSGNARHRGCKAYCEKHKGGPSARMAPLPCSVCGEPATRSSSSGARSKGYKPYCKEHPKGRRPLLPCAICGEPATKTSSETARSQGCKPFCEKHKHGAHPLLPCAICGEPATRDSSIGARSRSIKIGKPVNAYCAHHKKGPVAEVPRRPCAICGEPATRTSSHNARYLTRKAYCAKHKGGSQAKLPPLPCTICGAPATKTSAKGARHQGGNAYCAKHRGGKHV